MPHTEKVTIVKQQQGWAATRQGLFNGTFSSLQRLQVTWKESTFSKVTLRGIKKVARNEIICKFIETCAWHSVKRLQDGQAQRTQPVSGVRGSAVPARAERESPPAGEDD